MDLTTIIFIEISSILLLILASLLVSLGRRRNVLGRRDYEKEVRREVKRESMKIEIPVYSVEEKASGGDIELIEDSYYDQPIQIEPEEIDIPEYVAKPVEKRHYRQLKPVVRKEVKKIDIPEYALEEKKPEKKREKKESMEEKKKKIDIPEYRAIKEYQRDTDAIKLEINKWNEERREEEEDFEEKERWDEEKSEDERSAMDLLRRYIKLKDD
ncbi:MAG: hypothetical protein WCK90_01490 [archaeon]